MIYVNLLLLHDLHEALDKSPRRYHEFHEDIKTFCHEYHEVMKVI